MQSLRHSNLLIKHANQKIIRKGHSFWSLRWGAFVKGQRWKSIATTFRHAFSYYFSLWYCFQFKNPQSKHKKIPNMLTSKLWFTNERINHKNPTSKLGHVLTESEKPIL